tara:strand:+ start:370 stop:486 length:117 start_codon:yes stop_codon:yes gene_type:complete
MVAKSFVKLNEFELMKNKLMQNKNMMSFTSSLSFSFIL